MRILDLFSGTHSLANAARPLGHEVVTLDNALPADIECDFLTWDYTAYPPGHFDLVAASPPCAVWSNARMMNLGKLRLATGRPWTQAELDAAAMATSLWRCPPTEQPVRPRPMAGVAAVPR